MAKQETPALPQRFTQVHLENWRNFTRTDVELQQRVFVVGPNAAGKSNFLDAFRFLRDIVSIGGGFQEAVRGRGGLSRIRSLAARRQPSVSVRVSIGDDETPNAWTYELAFKQDNLRRPLVEYERVLHLGKELLRRPDSDDHSDPERLRQTDLEQVNANQAFRPVAEFLASVRYLHVIPQLVREPGRGGGRVEDPFGSDFIEQIARTQSKTRTAWLRRIRDALQVAVPQLTELEQVRDERGVPHLRGKYEHWRPQGAWQMETDFSDGTLRLLGLLWAMLERGGPLLLEEPEISLHPGVVRHLPEMFRRMQNRSGRQVLVSTHAAELIEDEGIGSDEVLLVIPGSEGAIVRPAGDFDEVAVLLESGLSMPEAVLPITSPKDVAQLARFSG